MKIVALLSLCIVVAMAQRGPVFPNNNLLEDELPPIVGEGGALPPGYRSPLLLAIFLSNILLNTLSAMVMYLHQHLALAEMVAHAAVIQFSILCGIQYALSFVENYFEESPDNYYELVLMSVPFFVQISNALALLLTNRLVRKALKLLIFRKNENSTNFVTAFVHNNSNITRVNGTKNQRAVKVTQAVMAFRTVERRN